MKTAFSSFIYSRKGIYGILHVLILCLSLFLIISISMDTFHNIPFINQGSYLRIQFWICMFFLFDFLFLYQLLLLCLNQLIEFLAGAFLSSLLHQLTLYGILQNGLLHVLRELGVKLLQLFIGGSIAVNQRKEFLNLGNDALLLVKRRQRN